MTTILLDVDGVIADCNQAADYREAFTRLEAVLVQK